MEWIFHFRVGNVGSEFENEPQFGSEFSLVWNPEKSMVVDQFSTNKLTSMWFEICQKGLWSSSRKSLPYF